MNEDDPPNETSDKLTTRRPPYLVRLWLRWKWTCKRCRGTGIRPSLGGQSTARCGNCDGRGYISTKPPEEMRGK